MTSNNYNFLFNFRVFYMDSFLAPKLLWVIFFFFEQIIICKHSESRPRAFFRNKFKFLRFLDFIRYIRITKSDRINWKKKYLRQSYELIQIALELLIDGVIVVSLCFVYDWVVAAVQFDIATISVAIFVSPFWLNPRVSAPRWWYCYCFSAVPMVSSVQTNKFFVSHR